MKQYLIIVKKRNNYNSGECEEIWLPATPEEIDRVLHKLGCGIVELNYEIIYSEFGCPEIDNKVNRFSNILSFNRIAELLQSFDGTANELCAELVYKGCQNEYDVITHLTHRPQLVVLESYKDITEYGKFCLQTEFWASSKCEEMTYEEYEDELYYDGSYPLWKRYQDCAMENLRWKIFRFTQYGLVYRDDTKAPLSFADIVVPF